MTIPDTLPQTPGEAIAAALTARMLARAETFNREVLDFRPPASPEVMRLERMNSSLQAFAEEDKEFEEAVRDGDVLGAADALIDGIYFRLGRLVEMGIPAAAVFDEVQRANMDKQPGEVSKRQGWNGKDAVKPAGWKAPDHSWLLQFTLADVAELQRLRAEAATREALSPVWKRLQELREAKGKDYNDVPGGRDAYFPFGHLSYAHMIHTKELRLQSLLRAMTSGRQVNFEGILDTVEDLVNYATYYAEAIRSGKLSPISLAPVDVATAEESQL